MKKKTLNVHVYQVTHYQINTLKFYYWFYVDEINFHFVGIAWKEINSPTISLAGGT